MIVRRKCTYYIVQTILCMYLIIWNFIFIFRLLLLFGPLYHPTSKIQQKYNSGI